VADTCRDCDQPVIWVGTVRGKRMAMEPRPDEIAGQYLVAHAKSPNGSRTAIFLRALNDSTRKMALTKGGVQVYRRHACRQSMERFERLKEAA
jgi:hypothetical protein